MSSIRLKIAVVVALYLSLGLSMLFGQANVGGIFGHVSDTSGGAIVGATLTLVNPATNERRTVQTDEVGDYIFNLVRPAN
jgi:protocatechuate 3,4-dioxygenase beta subunit